MLCRVPVLEYAQQKQVVAVWHGKLGLGLGALTLLPFPPAWGPEKDQSSVLPGLLHDDSQSLQLPSPPISGHFAPP